MPDYYGWGSRNLADTSLPGNEWAKEARAEIRALGLREPGTGGGQYAMERDSTGKLQVSYYISASGHKQRREPKFSDHAVQE